jgi:hypothetical protein
MLRSFRFDIAAKCVIHIPEFLSKTDFKNPIGPMGTFQSAFNTELKIFFWLMQHPQHMSDFNDLMEGQRIKTIKWYTFVGVENVLFKDQDTSDSMLHFLLTLEETVGRM